MELTDGGETQNGASDIGEANENDTSQNISETEMPSHMEDTHQKYIEMFARDSYHNDEEDEDSESE